MAHKQAATEEAIVSGGSHARWNPAGVKSVTFGGDHLSGGENIRFPAGYWSLPYLDDFSRLLPLVHHEKLGPAVPLIVSDVDGKIGGLQPLVAVALAAAPLVDVLQWAEWQEVQVNQRNAEIRSSLCGQ